MAKRRFETGGLNQVLVTAPFPTDAEREEYFRTHDANGNLIIPNEFAAPYIPQWGATNLPAKPDYTTINDYSLPSLASAPIETAMTIGSGALAYPLGAAYGVGRNVLSGKYGTTAGTRLADQEAARVAQALTYQPRTAAAQQALERIGKIFEWSKIPPIGVPELMGMQGMRRVVPNDLRAMHGKYLQVKEDVPNIKRDFQYAQSGIERDIPRTTLGASLQKKAKSLGDLVAERQQNERDFRAKYGLVPSLSDVSKSYIVSPGNVQVRVMRDPITGNINTKSRMGQEFGDLPVLGPRTFFNNASMEVRGLFDQYKRRVARETFPDAPDEDTALTALELRYDNNSDALRAALLPGFTATPEAQALGAVSYPAGLQARLDVRAKEAPNAWLRYIEKYLGSEKDPLLASARKGMTVRDPRSLLADAQYMANAADSMQWIRDARRAIGSPEEGIVHVQDTLPAKAALDEHKQLLPALIAKRDEAQAAWTVHNQQLAAAGQETIDPMAFPPYAEAATALNAYNVRKSSLEDAVANAEIGEAYELMTDYAMIPKDTVSKVRSGLSYERKQFMPGIDQAPADALLHNPRGLRDIGLSQAAEDYFSDVVEKGITPATTPVPGYLQNAAKVMYNKTKAEQKAIREEKSKYTDYLSQRIAAVPEDMKFGNVAVLELTNKMSKDEVMREASTITEVLDHCIGQGGQARNKTNIFTGDERTYVPMVDPLTGTVPKDSHGDATTYVDSVMRGTSIIGGINDAITGMPVATIQLLKSSPDQKYTVGYVSGYQNHGPVDGRYLAGIRDYLNTKADEIAEEHVGGLTSRGIFDLRTESGREGAVTGHRELADLQEYLAAHPETPRYATQTDVEAMIEKVRVTREAVQGAELVPSTGTHRNTDEILANYSEALAAGDHDAAERFLEEGRAALEDFDPDAALIGEDWVPEPPMTLPTQDPAMLTPEEFVQGMPNILNMLGATEEVRHLQVAFENPQTRARYTPEQLVAIDNAISSRMIQLLAQESVQDLYQQINEAATLEQLDALRMERRTRSLEFSPTENQMLMDAARDRSRELRANANQYVVLPDIVMERLNNLANLSDEDLTRWLARAESNDPLTIFADLNEEQTREVVTAIEYEMGRRGMPNAELGMKKGGVIDFSTFKTGDVKGKNYSYSADIDLDDKYGLGISKQGWSVKTPEGKFKGSDITELRGRYLTDDGVEYNVKRRPLEKLWSIQRDGIGIDVSPDYKGISYTKNFAKGGHASRYAAQAAWDSQKDAFKEHRDWYNNEMPGRLKEKYPELGDLRVNGSPLDTAEEFAGAADYGQRVADYHRALNNAKFYHWWNQSGRANEALQQDAAGLALGTCNPLLPKDQILDLAAKYAKEHDYGVAPQYKAEGGAVHNYDEVSRLADELAGAMYG